MFFSSVIFSIPDKPSRLHPASTSLSLSTFSFHTARSRYIPNIPRCSTGKSHPREPTSTWKSTYLHRKRNSFLHSSLEMEENCVIICVLFAHRKQQCYEFGLACFRCTRIAQSQPDTCLRVLQLFLCDMLLLPFSGTHSSLHLIMYISSLFLLTYVIPASSLTVW